MALNTPSHMLNEVHNNLQNADKMYGLFANPVLKPVEYQSTVPWVQKKIEKPETFTYTENRVIRFTLPRSGLIDPRSIRLSFNCRAVPQDVTTNTTLGHQGGFVFDISSIFSRVSLSVGRNQVISDQDGYNYLTRVLSKIGYEYQSTTSHRAQFQGLGSFAGISNQVSAGRRYWHSAGPGPSTKTQALDVSRRYLIPLNLGLFNQQRPIVLDPFSEQLELELTLDKGSMAIIHDLGLTQSTPTYYVEVGYPTLHFTYFPLSNSPLYKRVDAQLSNNGFSYQHIQWSHNQTQLNSKALKQRISIPINHKWIRYAIACITCEEDQQLQNWSAFRTYATLDPTLTQGAAYNGTNATILTERLNVKRASIKTYQWIYNKHQRFPELPCPVITAPIVPTVNSATGVVIDPPTNAVNAITPVPPIDSTYMAYGEEVWYHIEQLFMANKEMMMGMCLDPKEGYFAHYNSTNAGAPPLTATEESDAQNSKVYGTSGIAGRVACNFFMVGNFSQPLYDGTVACLKGGTDNETLELELELNGLTTNVSTPRMILHTFVAYDNILKVNYQGIELEH